MASRDFGYPQYQLSAEILGHSADVRAVKGLPANEGGGEQLLATASRDGTACLWRPEGAPCLWCPEGAPSHEYLLSKVMRQHNGYVSALGVMPSPSGGQPLIVTGGQDSTILVHSMDGSVDEPVEKYCGHTGLVTCVIFQHGQLISASWDSTVRVWVSPTQSTVFEAHKPAVWAIAGLYEYDGTKRIISGGADRNIKLWEVDTKLCLQEYHGHSDVVRDIKIVSSDTFLSAANDCSIRKWSVHSGQCLREFCGHEAFVYSLSLFPNAGDDDFASCGEDGTVRVWRGGDLVQTLLLPATSVWAVCCLENGDIATGSSDGVARIFSANSTRHAIPELLAVFNKKVEEHRTASSSKVDVKSLPGLEALSRQGRSTGDTMMVNNDGIPEVYQWNAQTMEWEKIGTAVGQAPESAKTYGGKEYDYVFDIELDDGSAKMRKMKLPYNKNTDPYLAASEFLSSNDLPAEYLDQVAQFIIQNAGDYSGPVSAVADPFTGGSRYIPGSDLPGSPQPVPSASDPFTGGGRYRPSREGRESLGLPARGAVGGGAVGGGADPFTGASGYRPQGSSDQQPSSVPVTFLGAQNSYFPLSDFKTFTSPADYGSKVTAKIREFNALVGQEQKLSEDQITRIEVLSGTLTSSSGSVAIVAPHDLQLIQTLMLWPPENVFPGLDLLRLALLNDSGNGFFVGDVDSGKVFLGELMAFAVGPDCQEKNQLLVLRSLANLFSNSTSMSLLHCERKWILSELSSISSSSSKPAQLALTTVLLNYCHYYSTSNDRESVADIVQRCVELLACSLDNGAKLRLLIGLGSLALVNKEGVISASQTSDLASLIRSVKASAAETKVSECADYLLQALQ